MWRFFERAIPQPGDTRRAIEKNAEWRKMARQTQNRQKGRGLASAVSFVRLAFHFLARESKAKPTGGGRMGRRQVKLCAFTIINPDGSERRGRIPRPRTLHDLHVALRPFLPEAHAVEQVRVFTRESHQRMTAMIVDEMAVPAGLPGNARATALYRESSLRRNPEIDAESMPVIAGTAVVFDDFLVDDGLSPCGGHDSTLGHR